MSASKDPTANGSPRLGQKQVESVPALEIMEPLTTAHDLILEAIAASIFRTIYPQHDKMYPLLTTEVSKLICLSRVALADALSILEEEENA
jgi:ribosomal protein S3AE